MKQIVTLTLLIATGVCLGQPQNPKTIPPPQEKTKEPRQSSPELDMIQKGSEQFAAAFNKHDAKAVAALWTVNGEYLDESGRALAGRDEIEKGYAEFFADNQDAKIQIMIDSVRLLSADTAIEDGRSVVELSPVGPPAIGRYTAVHVKVQGKWLMASVREAAVELSAAEQSAADLEWLIGTWVAEEHGNKSESVCRWVAGKSFVQRTYTTTMFDGTQTSGIQMIGWNPEGGHVQSWDFSSTGGHAVGVWSAEEGGWTSEIRGVTSDGVPTTSVNVLRRLDDDAYVWQSLNRTVGGMALPDTDEVVLKRQPDKR